MNLTSLFCGPGLPRAIGPLTCVLAALACGLAGCDRPEEIRVYQVAKPTPMKLPEGQAPADAGPSVSAPAEILGAIVPQDKTAWFFKIMAPPPAVAAVKRQFAEFLASLTFAGGKPDWNLPPGWEAQPGNDIRYATIQIPSGSETLSLTVIPLPSNPEKLESEVLSNVNRWRDQVGLGPLSADELASTKEVTRLELQGAPVWVADFIGESKGNTMGGGAAPQKSPPRQAQAAPAAGPLPFDCQVPDSWTRGRAGQFQLAVFDVRDGERQASVTVSVAGGDPLANINRWRGQIGLEDVSAAELAGAARELVVDGNAGIAVELVAPESAAPRKAILGVIVPAQGKQWFIKLTGDAELAAAEKTRFEEFVRSVKFR